MITRGSSGTLLHTAPDRFTRVPALATRVVDRVGAGDAVLCATSLCAAVDAPPEVTAFLGNVVGAEAVAILGNQRSIERVPTFRHVECLLKMHTHAAPPAPAPRRKKRAGGAKRLRVPPKG
jgi:bifunctional ADP-heptose synthase (sugar kinase/adenylyltransferase)